jgi:hypothetical protein
MDVKNIVNELKSERDRLDKAISALESIGERVTGESARAGRPAAGRVEPISGGKRRLSAAARRRISEAQKRRWAERKRAA